MDDIKMDNTDISAELQKNLLIRLRRIEGQVKGIHKMVENQVCCNDVLVQIAAIRAAINKVGGLLIENYARNCMGIEKGSDQEEGLEQLISTLNTFIK
ncbi:metal-sensitive transcriptional regulator [Clostridium polynesiense]|uniref:metal-sensitive transcriptional regulator n=1 Tax=Clostridium polynesiense TaxID=1325933 RepID=UPI000AA9FCC1|nr:metal-sensitive transcriptional regulator [Clostridium polynesiense]